MERIPRQRSIYDRLDTSLKYDRFPVWLVEDEVDEIQLLTERANGDSMYYYQKMLGRAAIILDEYYGWNNVYEPGEAEKRFRR